MIPKFKTNAKELLMGYPAIYGSDIGGHRQIPGSRMPGPYMPSAPPAYRSDFGGRTVYLETTKAGRIPTETVFIKEERPKVYVSRPFEHRKVVTSVSLSTLFLIMVVVAAILLCL